MLEIGPIRQFLFVFGIAVTRLMAAGAVVPFLSDQLVPGRVRYSLIFAWGLVIYPIVAPTIQLEGASSTVLLGLLVKEVLLGILLAFVASKMFFIAMSVGYFIDNQRGASMASVFDPTSGEQTSPVGQFLQQALMVLFYTSGGFSLFLAGLFESYLVWPIDTFYPTFQGAFPGFFLEFTDDVMKVVVVLSAPIIIPLFIAEFGLGLVNRFAPQLNVFFLAMPIKSILAVFILVLYLRFLLGSFEGEFVRAEVLFQFFRNVIS